MELLDIYRVDKADYDAYFHRLPLNELVKTTPEKGTTIYIDITDNNKKVCGYHTEEVMGMPANDYYIFNFIEEKRLSEPKTYRYITLSEEEYAEFLAKLMEVKKMVERIYLLHARAQSGKDTCAQIMKEEYEKRGKRIIVIAFADYVKWCMEKYYGISDFKSSKGRTAIQEFATDFVRHSDPTFWARTVGDFLKAVERDFDYVIIPDWRFRNEYSCLVSRFTSQIVVPVLITRPENEKTDNMTVTQREHLSETELDNWENFSYYIINKYGQLEETRQQLINMINKEETFFDD